MDLYKVELVLQQENRRENVKVKISCVSNIITTWTEVVAFLNGDTW